MSDPALLNDAQRVRPVAGANEQLLPVAKVLTPAIPRLRRGITVSVRGSTSLALLLAAGPSSAGLWVAVVGLPAVGVVAAAEAGIVLERLALVDVAARDVAAAAAVAIDGAEVVVVGGGIRSADARRLAARTRERGAVLVALDWPERADLRLVLDRWAWSGLGVGHGHLTNRRAVVSIGGREAGGRDRTAELSW